MREPLSLSAGPVSRRAWRGAAIVGTLAVLAAACGSAAGSPSSGASSSAGSSTTVPGGRPLATGSVASVSGSSMSVSSQFAGATSVTWTPTTTFSQTVTADAQDVTAGSCVSVTGTPPASASAAGPIVARTITISGDATPCPDGGERGQDL